MDCIMHQAEKQMSEQYKCDICGAPATVHLTQIVDGKIHKAHLCEKCAAKNKVAELPILKFTEMLAKTLAAGGKKASEEVSETESVGREPSKICPSCGMTDVAFEKKRLFGCDRCYEVFSEEIAALLPKIQRGKDYCGDAAAAKKVASGETAAGAGTPPAAAVPASAGAEELRARLEKAVAKEDYALAARLRDELRALESAASAAAVRGKPAARRVRTAGAGTDAPPPASPAKRSRARKKTSGGNGRKSSGGNDA